MLACKAGARSSRKQSRETWPAPAMPSSARKRLETVSFVTKSEALPIALYISQAIAKRKSGTSSAPLPCASQWLNQRSNSSRLEWRRSSGTGVTGAAVSSSERRSPQYGSICCCSASSPMRPSWSTSRWSRTKCSVPSSSTGRRAARPMATSETLSQPSSFQSRKRISCRRSKSAGARRKPSTGSWEKGLRPPFSNSPPSSSSTLLRW
mmetsp:Transcript_3129/g.10457  ORF Transcript_3129/g.10457 Transcript_3129/m.10457 type:complete len:208 (+) Transcript_3129:415-1038(+)